MEPHGLHSARDLAVAVEVSPSSITRLIHGEQTSEETIGRVAQRLGISADRVRELRGKPRPNPFTLDEEADRLSPTQRAAVRSVVRAMLEGSEEQSARGATVHQFTRPDVPTRQDEKIPARNRRGTPGDGNPLGGGT